MLLTGAVNQFSMFYYKPIKITKHLWCPMLTTTKSQLANRLLNHMDETAAPLVECAIKMSVLISDLVRTVLSHLAMVVDCRA